MDFEWENPIVKGFKEPAYGGTVLQQWCWSSPLTEHRYGQSLALGAIDAGGENLLGRFGLEGRDLKCKLKISMKIPVYGE